MKIEPRGKYAGVKIHLDGDECEELLAAVQDDQVKGYQFSTKLAQGTMKKKSQQLFTVVALGVQMASKIRNLQEEEPDLLKDRTPEQVKAILAKEVEKAKIQLDTLNAGGKITQIDKAALKKALLKHAE